MSKDTAQEETLQEMLQEAAQKSLSKSADQAPGQLQPQPQAQEAGTFKRQHPFEARRLLSVKMKAVYPRHVPLIVERRGRQDPPLPKSRFLAAGEKRMGEILAQVKGEMTLRPTEALFFLAGEEMIRPGESVARLYERWGDDDGFLYLVYSREESFGNSNRDVISEL